MSEEHKNRQKYTCDWCGSCTDDVYVREGKKLCKKCREGYDDYVRNIFGDAYLPVNTGDDTL